MAEAFKPSSTIRRFARVLHPKDAETPILTGDVREAVRQWMTELFAVDELKAVKVEPRRAAMLSGPPGCGKTTLAHHVAGRLGLALVCLKGDTVVSKYVGETGNNLGQIFDELEEQADRCILFLDELDSIGRKRMAQDSSAALEANRTVNILLTRLEAFDGIVIAASNQKEMIDDALWRRFGLHLEIGLPGDDERFAILARYFEPFRMPDATMDILVESTSGAPPALLRGLAEGIKRDLVISPRLDRSTEARPVIARTIASLKPHPEYARPRLWEDRAVLRDLDEAPWPPAMEDGGAA